MIAKEASFKIELKVLNEKLDLATKDRSLMVTDLVPHVVKTLFSSDSISAMLADLKEKAMLVSRGTSFEGGCRHAYWLDPEEYEGL
ncbi:hypothetical protein Tco_0712114 [Tanacetum coccineum]